MLKLNLFLILLAASIPLRAAERYLTVCAIFQNEAQWLEEWIEYHLLVGVDSFLLYENNSSDGWQAVLQPYIDKGVVEVVPWHWAKNKFPDVQIFAYNDSLKRLRGKSRWVAYIDIDEFICPIEHNSVAEFLRPYERFGGVVLNWRTFGTGGVHSLAEGELLIEMLRWCVPHHGLETHVVKSIICPDRVHCTNGVHRFCYQGGYFAVDTAFRRSDPMSLRRCTPHVCFNRCVINHYRLRTVDWAYGEKLKRNAFFYQKMPIEELKAQMDQQDNSFNQIENLDIQRFVPALKERMRCSK